MQSDEQEVEAAALRLDQTSRGRLARRLLESLDELDPKQLEALWVDEAHRRSEELRSGSEVAVSGEDALSEIENEIT